MLERQATAVTTENSAVIANQITSRTADVGPNGEELIETRFGRIAIRRDAPVRFPQGLLGMPDKTSFCLLEFPVKKFPQFRLLQSLDDDALSFITLPVDVNNEIVAREDVEKALKDLNIREEDATLLLVVTVHRGVGDVRISVNARAPLIVDSNRREATQYVFQNNRYLVQQPLKLNEQGA